MAKKAKQKSKPVTGKVKSSGPQKSHSPFVIPQPKLSTKNNTNDKEEEEEEEVIDYSSFQSKKPLKPTWWNEKHTGTNDLFIKFNQDETWYSKLDAYKQPDNKREPKSKVTISTEKALKNISTVYKEEVKRYHQQLNNSDSYKSDAKWMNDMINSGTLSDKIAALTLKIQESPFFELESFNVLVNMGLKKEQRVSRLAIEALKDLLINNLLPERSLSLLTSKEIQLINMDMTRALLLYYEDQLKQGVSKVVKALEEGVNSTLDHFKKFCLTTAAELLMAKPEQESRLLFIVVNKLGDPKSSVCAKSVELLKNLIKVHPAMIEVIVREVRQLVHLPSTKTTTINNGIYFLSQLPVSPKYPDVITQLVQCYVILYEKAVKEEEIGSRLLSALLTGINKVLPNLHDFSTIFPYLDSLFKIAHTSSSFSTSTQALMLISHLALNDKNSKNNEQEKGKKSEGSEGKEGNGQGLIEESNLMKRFYRALYAKLVTNQVLSRTHNVLFFNLLYRSIKRDSSLTRATAFIKRLCLCSTQSSPSIAAGILLIVSEILKARPDLKKMLNTSEYEEKLKNEGLKETLSEENEGIEANQLGFYDALKREPEFAATAVPSVWEISLLSKHFHPSVEAFSKSLLNAPHHEIQFNGDPTKSFNLMSFLNRFAYKNPKKQTEENNKNLKKQTEEPINNSSFLNLNVKEVAPDQLFFKKYFEDREKLVKEGKFRTKNKKSDDGSDDDDDDEENMDRYADKLAEDLMRDADPDDDLDDDDLDFGEDDEENEGFNDFSAEGLNEEGSEEDSSGDEMLFKEKDLLNTEEGEESEGSDEDFQGLEVYDEENELFGFDPDEEEEKNTKTKGNKKSSTDNKGKKAKETGKKRKNDLGDFAAAEDYEDEMEEILQQIKQFNGNNDGLSGESKGKRKSGNKKMKK